jgi:hypothetical protein
MDPIMLKALGEARLADLRRDAAAHAAVRNAERIGAARIPRWRRMTGRLLLGAGRRMMGGGATVVVIPAPE